MAVFINLLMQFAVPIGVVIAVVGLVAAIIALRRAEGDPLQDRLAEYGARDEAVSLDEVEMSLSFTDRILVPFMRGLANFVAKITPQQMLEATAKKLETAGLARRLSPAAMENLGCAPGRLALHGAAPTGLNSVCVILVSSMVRFQGIWFPG